MSIHTANGLLQIPLTALHIQLVLCHRCIASLLSEHQLHLCKKQGHAERQLLIFLEHFGRNENLLHKLNRAACIDLEEDQGGDQYHCHPNLQDQ